MRSGASVTAWLILLDVGDERLGILPILLFHQELHPVNIHPKLRKIGFIPRAFGGETHVAASVRIDLGLHLFEMGFPFLDVLVLRIFLDEIIHAPQRDRDIHADAAFEVGAV